MEGKFGIRTRILGYEGEIRNWNSIFKTIWGYEGEIRNWNCNFVKYFGVRRGNSESELEFLGYGGEIRNQN
jgi:hypothetical protein